MKKTSTWRFVLKIVGASLAFAGGVCLVVACWDKLAGSCCGLRDALHGKGKYSEFSDYEDELLYED